MQTQKLYENLKSIDEIMMISTLCEDDDEKWEATLIFVKLALSQRIKLWDSINNLIEKKTTF